MRCGNPLCQPPNFIHLQCHKSFSDPNSFVIPEGNLLLFLPLLFPVLLLVIPQRSGGICFFLFNLKQSTAKPSLEQQKVGFRPLISSAILPESQPVFWFGVGLPVRTRLLPNSGTNLLALPRYAFNQGNSIPATCKSFKSAI
jgi:hypothetical protein